MLNEEEFYKKSIQEIGLQDDQDTIDLYYRAWHFGWRGGPDEVLRVFKDLARIEKEAEDELERKT